VAVKGFEEVLQELVGSAFRIEVINEMQSVSYMDRVYTFL
jgi:hypothetical protein